MSADFWLFREERVGNWNLTYNLSKMFVQVSGGRSISDFMIHYNGVYANEIVDDAWEILTQIQDRKSELLQFNPENGWGTYDHLLETWEKFVVQLRANPDTILGSWL